MALCQLPVTQEQLFGCPPLLTLTASILLNNFTFVFHRVCWELGEMSSARAWEIHMTESETFCARGRRGERAKESFTTESIRYLVHSLILLSVNPTIFAMSLTCCTGDKGGENRSVGCSLSLFMWFQFSLIAGNLVFNIN